MRHALPVHFVKRLVKRSALQQELAGEIRPCRCSGVLLSFSRCA